MRNAIQREDISSKISSSDKETVEKAVKSALDWLDRNPDAKTDEFEAQQRTMESVCHPIMAKLYQSQGGGPGGDTDYSSFGGHGARPSSGPTVEEVD